MEPLPNVIGLSPVEARGVLRALGLSTEMIGSDGLATPQGRRVAVQQPEAGQPQPTDAIVHIMIDEL